MDSLTSYPLSKKTFVSSSHCRSIVALEKDHLSFCHDQKFIQRKIFYREIHFAKLQQINVLFYFIAALVLLVQVFIYLALKQIADSLYPVLSFILIAVFLIFIVLHGKCLYAVRIKRLGADTFVFYTSKRKEAKTVVNAINEKLKILAK